MISTRLTPRMRAIIFAMLLSAGLGASQHLQAGEPATVAAAADLRFSLEEIASQFRRETGQEVKLTYGSSGTFATQLEQGAPFQLFLSADEDYVFRLADKGLTQDRGQLYAIGRIVLFAPKGSPLTGQLTPNGMKAVLTTGRLKHFAIANPEHAPYGRAAQQWLEKHELWQAVQPTLLLGENAAQAAQFATSGSSEGGIIAYSLALASKVDALGTWVLLAAEDHLPLRQRMVRLKGANATADAFYAYMQSRPARQVMKQYGFALPGE